MKRAAAGLGTLGLLIAGVAVLAPGSASAGYAGPQLLTAATSAVNTSTGPATATIAIHATDDASAISYGDFYFTSPDGSQIVSGSLDGTPMSGSAADGTWQVPVEFPARAQSGTWTLTDADLADAAGTQMNYGADVGGVPAASVTVTNAADTTAPTLSSFGIGPSTVSLAYGTGARLVGHLGVTDSGSGIGTAEVVLADPTATIDDTDTIELSAADLTSGTSQNGVLTFSTVIEDATIDSRPWTVSSVTLTDLAGNARTLTGTALGTSTSTVVDDRSATDTAAPSLTSLAFSPAAVDPSAGAANVGLTLGATDPDSNPSGVVGAEVVLSSPSGKTSLTYDVTDPTGGDDVTGTWTGSQQLPAGAEAGVWKVSAVTLTDALGHVAQLTPADLATTLRTLPTLTVGAVAPTPSPTPTPTAGGDTTAPTLTAIGARSASLDVSTGSPLVLDVAATDEAQGSGPASVAVTMTGPGGRTAQGTTGLDTAGSGAVSIAVPALGSTGNWSISAVAVSDRAGNVHPYAAADLASFGGTHLVSVVGTVALPQARLVITAVPTRLYYGAAAAVSGRLTRADTSSAVAGQTVRLQYRRSGTSGGFHTFATTARSNSAGTVSFRTFRPTYSVQLRLYVPTSTAVRGAVSTNRTAAVLRRISVVGTSVRVRHGAHFTIRGYVSPATIGSPLYLQRTSHGRWVQVATTRVGTRGAYGWNLRASTYGHATYRVIVHANATFAASASRVRYVVVV